jgi:hypothetical protein
MQERKEIRHKTDVPAMQLEHECQRKTKNGSGVLEGFTGPLVEDPEVEAQVEDDYDVRNE